MVYAERASSVCQSSGPRLRANASLSVDQDQTEEAEMAGERDSHSCRAAEGEGRLPICLGE